MAHESRFDELWDIVYIRRSKQGRTLVLCAILVLLFQVLVLALTLLLPPARRTTYSSSQLGSLTIISHEIHNAVLFLATFSFAIYILPKAVKGRLKVMKERARARIPLELATFLTTNADIRRMVVTKLPLRDVIRFSIVKSDWRAILQERGESGKTKVQEWYFPLWFQNIHSEGAVDRNPSPSLTPPVLPTNRYTNIKRHGVHHDNTSHEQDHFLYFLDFLWENATPGNQPLGFMFAATSRGLLFYMFVYTQFPSSILAYGVVEMNALLTVQPFYQTIPRLAFSKLGYQDVINLWTFEGDGIPVVVDKPPSSVYRVFLVISEFVKEWSFVSNEWTTSRVYIDAFVAFSSLYYQGCLHEVRKWGLVMVVAVLEKSELGAWEFRRPEFATVYKDEMFGRIKVELHLVGCNGQLYVVMGTEEDTLTWDKSLVRSVEFDLFELPVGCRSFLKVAHIPLRFFTEMSREYKYKRHDGQWYQGWRQEKFCCTAKGR